MATIEKTFRQETKHPSSIRDLSSLQSDTVDLIGECVKITIETAAAVKVTTEAGEDVIIPAVIWTSEGLSITARFKRVWSTGTGATGEIFGYFV